MVFEIAIIGGGPTGLFSVFMSGIFGFKKIALIESSEKLGGKCSHLYPKKNIYDVAGIPEITGEGLIQSLEKQMSKFSPEIFLNSTIVKVEKNGDVFVLKTNNPEVEIKTYKIMLACGKGVLEPRKPTTTKGFLEAEASGIIQYSLKDPEMFRNKDIIIGGGGDSALDWCFDLQGIAKSITIIHRSSLRAMKSSQDKLMFLAEKGACKLFLQFEIEEMHQTTSQSTNIENRWQMTVSSAEKEEKGLLEFDFFIPCYGSNSNSEAIIAMVRDLKVEISETGEIVANNYRTSEKGVYIATTSDWMTVAFGEATLAAEAASKDVHGEQHVPYSSSNTVFVK